MDHAMLTRLGPGVFEIDVLNETCNFSGKPIEPLKIVHELSSWLRHDLVENGIPVEAVKGATVRVELNTGPLQGERKTSNVWFWDDGRYIACDISCNSSVQTDEKQYICQYRDYEEWPLNWWTKKHDVKQPIVTEQTFPKQGNGTK